MCLLESSLCFDTRFLTACILSGDVLVITFTLAFILPVFRPPAEIFLDPST